jgi:hypothetical protein
MVLHFYSGSYDYLGCYKTAAESPSPGVVKASVHACSVVPQQSGIPLY